MTVESAPPPPGRPPEPPPDKDRSLACWIANFSICVLGTLGSTLAVALLSPWPWWAALLLLPLFFVAWSLLVERLISGLVNHLIEGGPRK